MPDPASFALQATATGLENAYNLTELISAAHRVKRETAELASLKQPFYKIQDEYFQNKNITAAEASGGLPLSVKNELDKQRRTGLGTSISSLLQSGAMPGDITKLFDVYDNSVSADAARDAEAHQKNIETFMEANKELAGQKTTQYVVNELQPYERKLNQLTENIATDKGNVHSAIQGIISSVSSLGNTFSAPDTGGSNRASTDLTTRPSLARDTVSSISADRGTLPGLAPISSPNISSSSSGQTYSIEEIMQLLNQLKK